MGEDLLYDLARRGLLVLTLAALPPLGAALAIGLVIGLVQAATSINEATLSFVPKLVGVFLVLVLFGGLIGGLLVDFTREAIEAIPALVR
ncbi:MAG: flagellar biosynthetic protein FliQ [Thermaurantiacus tibetensis]|uniref:flagellar biosynthetic protein FliQ n=1 Tax=Thermaurantiacus tibetensis TaxID=2759035 RepID=UPI00188E5843|nr:flagellar biosynthetic protein FliQ [Thermaurantiacus tibetensis]